MKEYAGREKRKKAEDHVNYRGKKRVLLFLMQEAILFPARMCTKSRMNHETMLRDAKKKGGSHAGCPLRCTVILPLRQAPPHK